ncbi:MAG: clan AA aspartic protease [Chitinophagales bacterium]|jgi:predicted aspartyl protease|nr:clan AA aspartic protease [Sphingobacteriales bacterium]MBP7534553.1 clan AA aspartic protease [Chitinophagales bacterium]
MSVYKFELPDEDSLIILKGKIANDNLSLALDTGASHTVIDLSTLLLAGYNLQDSIGTVSLETANGAVNAFVFKLNSITVLGKTILDMEVCSYDFFLSNVLLDIHGVLGLDFFQDSDLLISFKRFEITLN